MCRLCQACICAGLCQGLKSSVGPCNRNSAVVSLPASSSKVCRAALICNVQKSTLHCQPADREYALAIRSIYTGT